MPTTFANTINGDEILAKRSQCDYAGNDIQTTYATKSELPTATSDLTNDTGYITLSDVPAQVNADWDASSGVSEILNKPVIPSGSQLVPAATSADADKVLKVNASGTPEWSIGGGGSQVNSDWDATSGVAEILNKPDLSVYATTSAMNAALADKQDTLTAGTNVSISNNVISATDTTYTAGTGIEISNNEISVEAPVDIVAGPGIVIDNPDGNTLRVSTEADAETVLCTETAQTNTHTLSESPYNFKYLRFEFFANGYSSLSTDAVLVPMNSGITAINVLHCLPSTANWGMVNELFTVSPSTITMTQSHRLLNNWSTNSITHQQGADSTVKQIVGIHRIANN